MPVTMEPFGRQQQLQGTSTTTHRPEESKVDRYTQFLFLLVSSILTLAALMCVARIIFVYCSYKRRQQDERHRRTQTRTVTVEAELNHGFNFAADGGGVTNYGFTDPPPRYDQLFKREEPPPLYASVRNSQIITSPRQSTESALREDETHSLPTYEQEFNRRSPSMRSGSTSTAISVLSGNILSNTEQSSAQEVDIDVITQQIQTHMDAVHRRYIDSVDLTNARAGNLSEEIPPH